MRFTSLVLKFLALLIVYAFACGALVQQGASEGYWRHFFARLLDPLNGLNPIAGSILIAGIFLFAAAIAIHPRERQDGKPTSMWTSLLLAAFAVDAIAVCASAGFIFAGVRFTSPGDLGALFVAGVIEGVIGVMLGAVLFFLKRPRIVYLPTLGLLLVGMGALGAIFWLGNGA
jgi:hypothetical protein